MALVGVAAGGVAAGGVAAGGVAAGGVAAGGVNSASGVAVWADATWVSIPVAVHAMIETASRQATIAPRVVARRPDRDIGVRTRFISRKRTEYEDPGRPDRRSPVAGRVDSAQFQ